MLSLGRLRQKLREGDEFDCSVTKLRQIMRCDLGLRFREVRWRLHRAGGDGQLRPEGARAMRARRVSAVHPILTRIHGSSLRRWAGAPGSGVPSRWSQ